MLNITSSKSVQTLALSIGILTAGFFGSTIQTSAQSVPLGVSTSQALSFQVAQGIPIAEMERMVFQRINQYRVSRGLSAMVWSDDIAQHAREHSRNMAKKTVPFGHQGFEQRSKAISRRISVQSTGENVAWISSRRDPIGRVVEAWIKSQKHRENIEGNFNITGIGIGISAMGGYYFTQDFARK